MMKDKLSVNEFVAHQYLCLIQDDTGVETVTESSTMVREITNDSVITEAEVLEGLQGLVKRGLAYSKTDKYGETFGLTSMRDS